jgi:hypothetical protein
MLHKIRQRLECYRLSEQKPLKDARIVARVPGELRRRLERAYELYGVTEATLVRDALDATLDYIERTKGYRRPISMNWDEPQAMAAEAAAPYGQAKGFHAPAKPPDKSQRHRGDGPRRAVS